MAVTELRENTFYAEVTLQLNGREIPIDSRPSDALALAVRTGAPIFAAEDVISESAIEFEHEVEDTEEVVEKFKDFLDNVTPEDFAGGDEPSRARAKRRRLGRQALERQLQDPVPPARRTRSPPPRRPEGSRLVSVSPGIGFTSSTVSSPAASSIRSTRAKAWQPSRR